jgi:hypothetical protein
MRLRHESLLPLSRARVVALFTEPGLRGRWQPGLQAYRHVEGKPGTAGARAELVVQLGGRPVVMLETVLCHAPPDEFSARYDAEGIVNVVHNRFSVADEGTWWEVESQVTLPPLFALLGPLLVPVFARHFDGMVAGFRDLIASECPRPRLPPYTA